MAPIRTCAMSLNGWSSNAKFVGFVDRHVCVYNIPDTCTYRLIDRLGPFCTNSLPHNIQLRQDLQYYCQQCWVSTSNSYASQTFCKQFLMLTYVTCSSFSEEAACLNQTCRFGPLWVSLLLNGIGFRSTRKRRALCKSAPSEGWKHPAHTPISIQWTCKTCKT